MKDDVSDAGSAFVFREGRWTTPKQRLCQCGRYLVRAGRSSRKCCLGTPVTSALPSPKVFTKRVWNKYKVLFLQLCTPYNCWRLVVSVDCWVVGDFEAVSFARGFISGETSDWIFTEALPRIPWNGKCKTHNERSTSSLTVLGGPVFNPSHMPGAHRCRLGIPYCVAQEHTKRIKMVS